MTRRVDRIGRWAPEHYTQVVVDEPDLHVYGTPDGLVAICYLFARSKPDWHLRFHNVDSRDRKIADTRHAVDSHRAMMAERRQRRTGWRTELQIGSILHGSWGYDQTNAEFYEVVEIAPTGKSVKVRELAHQSVPGSQGFMSETVMPKPGVYSGEPITKRVQPGDSISFEHFCLSLWHGRPVYSSWYA